ncbi:MAG: hypothetical protein F4160_16375 [Rhodospirillaceae bacterium]|nr:hypothetical protein [Rhodospirillaceae bacterium]MYH38366.1 hypothetical protein [Rhodospirillaceae bacterium]MYK15488.1 hypothetical protein [Rhodospirillaceae bacterium]
MRILLLCLLLILPAGPAAADALQEFHSKVGAAMKHVRLGQFYLRTGNLAVAGAELDEAAEKWAAVTAEFAAKPPDKLAGDSAFEADIEAVAGALDAALAAVDKDERDAATAHLKPVAGRLAALRKRNGLWIFSDCIAAMNRAMDTAFVYRRKPPNFADAAQVATMDRRFAALAHWYRRCYREAGPRQRADPAFERLFPGSLESIERLIRAAKDKSALRVINNLRELRSFDRLIWLYLG